MPKVFDKTPSKMKYPSGCREISMEISNDELLKRLKMLARAFQDMSQDDTNKYGQLALYLASDFFFEHNNKDVRLLVACCIADVFRISAPDAPYVDVEQIKEIFMFLTQQLRGLQDIEAPSFKRYFYLLENLAWVKSFNILLELEDNQVIFCTLFKLFFTIVSDKHSAKVTNFMLDMMTPLIVEADAVSQELLDIVLLNILEPYKTQNRIAYNLAKDLIKRTANQMEPFLQIFFNNTLMLGNPSKSSLGTRMFDLIYELNMIASSILLAVLPQLEFKLKGNDEAERKSVTKLLARMFSDPESDLAVNNKQLWNCFLGRFNDIDKSVRLTCVQATESFINNHPELIDDLAEPLKQRTHDPEEEVRMAVVQSVISASKKDFTSITQDLLDCVKERTLDKKFKIRKEALMGLGHIYRRYTQKDSCKKDQDRVAWIKNKVLHTYYQPNLDDKVVVERILNMSLVPYNLNSDDRMHRLYCLYGNLDDNAVKALQQVFLNQLNLRKVLRSLLDLHTKEYTDQIGQVISARLVTMSRAIPESLKPGDSMRKFHKIIQEDARIRAQLGKLVSPDCPCKKAEECVKEILKKMGNPVPTNFLYSTVKTLLERMAPLLIDATAIKSLLRFVDDAVNGLGTLVDEVPHSVENGMKLLLMLAHVFPGVFQSEEVFVQLIGFIKHEEEVVSDVTMEIFALIGQRLEQSNPQVYSSLLPVLQKMIKIGTPKQAKHAIRCIDALCRNKAKIFEQIFDHLKNNMDAESPYFLSSLVAIGHIAKICPGEFAAPVKTIVSKFIVKDLLMSDSASCRKTTDSWYADHLVSAQTQAKVQALKMMVHWLLGVKSNINNSATSTLRLLHTMIQHDGDLMERGKINKAEMARLRLQAGCCLLKLAQEPAFIDLVTLQQFQELALLINDPCLQVRQCFAQKLHRGLISLRLPLQYLSILCLAANDSVKERKTQIKQHLLQNIQKRRDYLKTNASANSKIFSLLPDYVLPYAIHLLTHDPEFKDWEDIATLKSIRECLWFIMEPLITKNDNYSYSFYKRMIENIKQTKDKQNADSEVENYKMYAVCDLALGLVMTKTTHFILKDFPAEPVLPARLFTQPDQSYSNTQTYLPKELMFKLNKSKVPGITTPQAAAPISKAAVNGSPQGSDAASAPNSPGSADEVESGASDNETPKTTTSARGRKRKTVSAKAANTPANRENQGKITDFMTRGSRKLSETAEDTRTAESVASSNQSSRDSSPDQAEETAKQKKTRGRSVRSQSSESESSVLSSQAGSQQPANNKRGRPARATRGSVSSEVSEHCEDVPPSPAESASSKGSESPPDPKKRRTKHSEAPVKSYPKRSKNRPIVNGTSDGEDYTPESQASSLPDTATPPRKPAANASALARAIAEEPLGDINIQRNRSRKTKR